MTNAYAIVLKKCAYCNHFCIFWCKYVQLPGIPFPCHFLSVRPSPAKNGKGQKGKCRGEEKRAGGSPAPFLPPFLNWRTKQSKGQKLATKFYLQTYNNCYPETLSSVIFGCTTPFLCHASAIHCSIFNLTLEIHCFPSCPLCPASQRSSLCYSCLSTGNPNGQKHTRLCPVTCSSFCPSALGSTARMLDLGSSHLPRGTLHTTTIISGSGASLAFGWIKPSMPWLSSLILVLKVSEGSSCRRKGGLAVCGSWGQDQNQLLKLQGSQCRRDRRENFITVGATWHWNSLPRYWVGSLPWWRFSGDSGQSPAQDAATTDSTTQWLDWVTSRSLPSLEFESGTPTQPSCASKSLAEQTLPAANCQVASFDKEFSLLVHEQLGEVVRCSIHTANSHGSLHIQWSPTLPIC